MTTSAPTLPRPARRHVGAGRRRQPMSRPDQPTDQRPPVAEGAAPDGVAEPGIADLPDRPVAPIILRYFGCEADMIGVNSDYFVVGDDDAADVLLPPEMRPEGGGVRLRFSRGAEGWRLSPAEGRSVYVNQACVTGLTALRSGDVVRLEAAGPGVQFTVMHQNAEPLASLAARFAPRLLSESDGEADTPRKPSGWRDPNAAGDPRRFGPAAAETQTGDAPSGGRLFADALAVLREPAGLVAVMLTVATIGVIVLAVLAWLGEPPPDVGATDVKIAAPQSDTATNP